MSDTRTTTRHHRGDAVEVCGKNGWGVGTLLVGDEGYGPTIIQITALGDRQMLARAVAHNGRAVRGDENNWVLWCRDWTEFVGDVPLPTPIGTKVAVRARPQEGAALQLYLGVVETGPDHAGIYKVHVPAEGKWVWTSDLEVIR